MSELERTVQRAFDAVRLPDDVAVRTLAFIEAARAEEAAAPEAPGETIASSGEPCGIQADGSFAAHAAAAGTPAAGQASSQAPVVTPAVQAAAQRRARRPRRWARIAVAACLAAALAGGGGVVYASESAYVEISADGTVPSAADAGADGAPAPDGAASGGSTESAVELGLNCFNVVVRATGLNEAGQALLDKVDVVGKSYEEAAAALLGQDATGSDGFVDVTVTSGNAGQRDYLNQTSESCLDHRESGTYACGHASEETWQAGRESGMGTARYQAFLELQQLDPSVTVEDCQDLTLREMRLMVEALESGAASDASQARDQAEASLPGHHGEGAGQGHGYGAGAGGNADGESAGQPDAASSDADAGHGNGHGRGQGANAGQGNGHGSGQGRGHGAAGD